MEPESNLRAQYEDQLDGQKVEIDRLLAKQAELQATIDKQTETISTQLETITDLSGKVHRDPEDRTA